MATPTATRADEQTWSTREAILVHASRLFAMRGFRGTSTRDICAAVGIRQPSMYSHFHSKHEIAEELLRRDLEPTVATLSRLAASDSPSVELYRYIRWATRTELALPYDPRAIYAGEILSLPELTDVLTLLHDYERLLEDLVRRGVAAEEFVEIDTTWARRAIDVVVFDTLRLRAEGLTPLPDVGDVCAGFVLRAMLRAPSKLPAVRRGADRADAARTDPTTDLAAGAVPPLPRPR